MPCVVKNHFRHELFGSRNTKTARFCCCPTDEGALRSKLMMRRGSTAALALCLSISILASCAKKHHVRAATAPSPQIQSGETGLASWYGHPYHGRAASNGEIYDMEKLTAAHRTLPFGTWVHVTNLANNKSVDVRIIDRGPFIDGRIIDLSHAAAQAIDLIGPGVAQVRLDILSSPQVTFSDSSFAVQAGAFRDKDRAERLRAAMEREYGSARLVMRTGSPSLWRVVVGRESSEQAAGLLAQRVRAEVGPAFVVRLDEPSTSLIRGSAGASQP
jgi:rare lipoprotein A